MTIATDYAKVPRMKTTPEIFLRSLLFNLCYLSWAMISAISFVPLFLISSEAALKAGVPWAKVVLWLARVICGMRYEIRGEQYMIEGPFVFASKHQSAWETAFFYSQFKRPNFVLKKELLRIPLWGWYLWRMKMIAIDRKAAASSLKDMIRQSKESIADGRPIIIFPEGTRMKPGTPANYHPGVVALYSQLKVPVVPVALNSAVYWGKNAFTKYPGTIIVEFLTPIPPGLDKETFKVQLQDAIETKSQSLLPIQS